MGCTMIYNMNTTLHSQITLGDWLTCMYIYITVAYNFRHIHTKNISLQAKQVFLHILGFCLIVHNHSPICQILHLTVAFNLFGNIITLIFLDWQDHDCCITFKFYTRYIPCIKIMRFDKFLEIIWLTQLKV